MTTCERKGTANLMLLKPSALTLLYASHFGVPLEALAFPHFPWETFLTKGLGSMWGAGKMKLGQLGALLLQACIVPPEELGYPWDSCCGPGL
mmetsp:Transcript_33230/g.59515  ORF Transcript_33230/g.59515 Transcript_33230/m.59515 type:complete len:92 (+) Transcript_33230:304-579(+)